VPPTTYVAGTESYPSFPPQGMVATGMPAYTMQPVAYDMPMVA